MREESNSDKKGVNKMCSGIYFVGYDIYTGQNIAWTYSSWEVAIEIWFN